MHVVMSTDSLSLPRPWFQKRPSEEPDKFTRIWETYPLLVETELRQRYAGETVRVTNMATRASGITATFTQRIDIFSWLEPTITLIHKGVVDCWPREQKQGEPNTPLPVFEETVVKLMEERHRLEPNNRLIIVGISPTNQHALSKSPGLNDIIGQYNEVLRRFRDARTWYIDMEAIHAEHGDPVLHPDGHHLSRIGHQVLARAILDGIEVLMAEGNG